MLERDGLPREIEGLKSGKELKGVDKQSGLTRLDTLYHVGVVVGVQMEEQVVSTVGVMTGVSCIPVVRETTY